jgi:hypothetical protein
MLTTLTLLTMLTMLTELDLYVRVANLTQWHGARSRQGLVIGRLKGDCVVVVVCHAADEYFAAFGGQAY